MAGWRIVGGGICALLGGELNSSLFAQLLLMAGAIVYFALFVFVWLGALTKEFEQVDAPQEDGDRSSVAT